MATLNKVGRAIRLEDGAGGAAMGAFLKRTVLSTFSLRSAGTVGLDDMDDGATVTPGKGELVFTTDSYTVSPIFFPGGNIGKLAACGTINDLAVMGARPRALSLGSVIEEGFLEDEYVKILRSMDEISRLTKTAIICGDTKVVQKGSLDGLILNTAGIGFAEKVIVDSKIKDGDAILVSGPVGSHGVTIMNLRQKLGLEGLKSDCKPVLEEMGALQKVTGVHAAKDPTRGGLAAALNEFASSSRIGIEVSENEIPVEETVKAACEMLGVDPLALACEGRVVVAVPQEKAGRALSALKRFNKKAAIIGRATSDNKGRVILETSIGAKRILEMPLSDPVPRIC